MKLKLLSATIIISIFIFSGCSNINHDRNITKQNITSSSEKTEILMQDGRVKTENGEKYFLPKKVIQYGTNGEIEFNQEISIDENSEFYYLEVFANDIEQSHGKDSVEYSLNEDGYISEFDGDKFEFDENGNLLTVARTEHDKTTFKYDIYDRVIEVQLHQNENLEYKYDSEGRVTSESTSWGGSITRKYVNNNSFKFGKGDMVVNYDNCNHITSIGDASFQYEYDENMCITKCICYDEDSEQSIERRAEYQEVSKTDYINYIVMNCLYTDGQYIMPMDIITPYSATSISPLGLYNEMPRDWMKP